MDLLYVSPPCFICVNIYCCSSCHFAVHRLVNEALNYAWQKHGLTERDILSDGGD